MRYLKPLEPEPYVGEGSESLEVVDKDAKVEIVFSSIEEANLFRKYIRVNTYKRLNVGSNHLGILVQFFKALEKKKLRYDLEEDKLYYRDFKGRESAI